MLRELTTVKAVCPHDCPDTCGMIVTVDPSTGRAVELRGDPDHPFTRGFLCQKVANYLDRVYHPDRLLYPLRRSARRGRGGSSGSPGRTPFTKSPHISSKSRRLHTAPKPSCRTATPGRWGS